MTRKDMVTWKEEIAPPSKSESWLYRHSRLGRLIEKVTTEGYQPMPQANRSYYTTSLWTEFLVLFGLIIWYFTQWYPAWLWLWPMFADMFFICLSASGLAAYDWLVDHAPVYVRPGVLRPFTCVDESVNVQSFVYECDCETPKQAILVLQMVCLGGLPIPGDFFLGQHVLISRILQTDVEEGMTRTLLATGKDPKLPPDVPVTFGRQDGRILDVPGDLEYYVLGNVDDGLEDELKNWVVRTYPHTNARTIVMVGRDVLQFRKDYLDKFSNVAHHSGHDWHAADLQRQNNALRLRLEKLTGQEAGLASAQSGFAVLPGGGPP